MQYQIELKIVDFLRNIFKIKRNIYHVMLSSIRTPITLCICFLFLLVCTATTVAGMSWQTVEAVPGITFEIPSGWNFQISNAGLQPGNSLDSTGPPSNAGLQLVSSLNPTGPPSNAGPQIFNSYDPTGSLSNAGPQPVTSYDPTGSPSNAGSYVVTSHDPTGQISMVVMYTPSSSGTQMKSSDALFSDLTMKMRGVNKNPVSQSPSGCMSGNGWNLIMADYSGDNQDMVHAVSISKEKVAEAVIYITVPPLIDSSEYRNIVSEAGYRIQVSGNPYIERPIMGS
jgi:hypothetical protein